MVRYPWPGNVRELSNVIERTIVTSEKSEISVDDLPKELVEDYRDTMKYPIDNIGGLNEAVEQLERQMITEAYEKCGTTIGVAEYLNISQPTASRKIMKYIVKE